MRRLLALLAILALGVFMLADVEPAAAGPDEARALRLARTVEQQLIQVVERAARPTVSILARSGNGPRSGGRFALTRPLSAVGSGVLIRRSGLWILTNHHVVDTDGRLEVVASDGVARPVYVRARNEASDLALLGFRGAPPEVPGLDLDVARLVPQRSSEGAWVIATGNPFFLALDGEAAASLGVLSGIRPRGSASYIEGPTFQHDAEINPGSSGGPLWDLRGALIGVNGTIATRAREQGSGPAHTGASFSVPLVTVRQFLDRTLGRAGARQATTSSDRAVPRLGLRCQTQAATHTQPGGARVTGVVSPSPASPQGQMAWIQLGDVITGFQAGGQAWTIRSASDVSTVLATVRPGSAFTLRFVRSGRLHRWSGRLASEPE